MARIILEKLQNMDDVSPELQMECDLQLEELDMDGRRVSPAGRRVSPA